MEAYQNKLNWLLLLSGLFLSACSSTVNIRSVHFAVPYVSPHDFKPRASVAGSIKNRVKLLEDISTNPPVQGSVSLNRDSDMGALLWPLTSLSLDLGLSLTKGTEIYSNGTLLGLKWQFLNHDYGENMWVSTIHAAGSQTQESYRDGESEADTAIKTRQAGISIGYLFTEFVPYISYIYEGHDTKTKVKNSADRFGPYNNSGIYNYVNVGIAKVSRGLSFAVEASSFSAIWDKGETHHYVSTGFRLGYQW